MQGLSYRDLVMVLAVAVLLSACAPLSPQVAEPSAEIPAVPLVQPLVDIAPKSDSYTVKTGDTLIRIALDSGQSVADIARWNGVNDPARIVVGQVLRLTPPLSGEAPPLFKPATSTSTLPPSTATVVVSPNTTDEDVTWTWPTKGPVLAGFSQSKNKGLEIGGAVGEAVFAAADGKVVYAGTGLRGYGNLIILKHNQTYVSLYAHNKILLVKEDEAVKRGQKIAEMGHSETDRVKLGFEVRKSGNSVDPSKYLPAK